MAGYVTKRLLSLAPVIVIVALLSFFLIHLTPGDPASVMLGTEATPERVAEVRKNLGLDKPLHEQFFLWVSRAVQGDLGSSYYMRMPVTTAVMERLPLTLIITVLATLICILIGVPAGVVAAVKWGTWVDTVVMMIAVFALSVPSFWLGLNLVYLFSLGLGWFPTGGYVPLSENLLQGLRTLALPCFALGAVQAALVARQTRSSVLDVLRTDYIRTARAKGLHERTVVYRHALKNAMIPVVTVLGISFGVLMGGAVIIEVVFTLPGMGRLVVNAVARRDYPVIQGAVLFSAISYLLVNLAVDLSYLFFDPRIKYA